MQKLRLFPTVVMLIFLSFTACKTTKTTTSIPAPPPPPAAPAVVEAMPVVLTDAELAAKKDYSGTYPDVRAGKYDNGKMWTFAYPPKKYFTETYGFTPSDEWLNSVRQSALRFATYCTASFVSEDGLVMTNHHCGRESVTEVNKEGENLPDNGFYAKTLADERKVPGLFVDQLISMKDITDEVNSAAASATTPDAQAKQKQAKIKELIDAHANEKDMTYQVHDFYNGSIYQLFGYKRYNDVRLVMAPETALGFFGGDPDNFTYPRYCLDYTFFRVYDENGKPMKTTNYFHWSPDGPKGKEPIFVVGNPGTTKRLSTMAQLEYDRDYIVPANLDYLRTVTKTYGDYLENHPDKKLELTDTYFGFSNSLKAYEGIYSGLKDPVLMGKRADFEKQFKAQVFADPNLKKRYGHLWDDIENSRSEMKSYFKRQMMNAPTSSGSTLFNNAAQMLGIADQMSKPVEQRPKGFETKEAIEMMVDKIFDPKEYYPEIEQKMVELALRSAYNRGSIHVPAIAGMKKAEDAENLSKKMVSNTVLDNTVEMKSLIDKGPEAIYNSNDPFIQYVKYTRDSLVYYRSVLGPLAQAESQKVQELGRALYSVYGTDIPPDANFTLRIADGVMDGYNYNGTEAPEHTTFYGLYDRYYSNDPKSPWSLPNNWLNPPASFDKSTPMNFVSTNDIIGGNSGSALINANREVVGLAFDGNIESLPGRYIFDVESGNRTVSVHSSAILASIRDLYLATRLADELKNSKIMPEKVEPSKSTKKNTVSPKKKTTKK